MVVEDDGAVSATYSYDDNGNRTDAVVDEQDRLLSHGTFTYGWDADGALVSRTDTSTNATMRFAYDTLGGLRQVTLSDGRVIDYVIDGLGRRIGKRVDGVLQQGFVYDGQLRIVAELDGSGVVRRRYVYSSHANVPDIAIDVLTGETWRIITDHLGSPRLVVDVDDGTIVAEREFDEFGRVVIDSAPGLLPFGFAGGLEDPDTGLVRFGARDYDPESGRWTAKDPIGFNGGTTNLYEYAGNDPLNFSDPSGLFAPVLAGAAVGVLVAFMFAAPNDDNVNLALVGAGGLAGAAIGAGIGAATAVGGSAAVEAGGGVCAAESAAVGGRLGQVLGGIEQGFAANAPQSAMEALAVIQRATSALGLEVGVASLGVDGSIVLTNVGGITTFIGVNGSIIVQRGSQILLSLSP